MPIVKFFVENKADEAAMYTAFNLIKLWHNSNCVRAFEETVRNGDVDILNRLFDNKEYILNDDYQGNTKCYYARTLMYELCEIVIDTLKRLI